MGVVDKTTVEVQDALDQQLDGDQVDSVGYDDIQGSLASAKLGAAAPTWVDYAYGIGGGVTFKALSFAVNDVAYFTVQTPHAMKLDTTLDWHIHYTPDGDGTNDKFKFQIDVISAGVGADYAVPTGSPFTSETTMISDYSTKHVILELADIPLGNATVSTIYKLKLTRIAASADEYAGGIIVDFSDGHIQIDQERGSRSEYTK